MRQFRFRSRRNEKPTATPVSNAQTLSINLIGVTGGTRSGNVSIPMSVLIGDTNADSVVNSTDVSQTQAQSGNRVTQSNSLVRLTIT
jgi:hypothetical protein